MHLKSTIFAHDCSAPAELRHEPRHCQPSWSTLGHVEALNIAQRVRLLQDGLNDKVSWFACETLDLYGDWRIV